MAQTPSNFDGLWQSDLNSSLVASGGRDSRTERFTVGFNGNGNKFFGPNGIDAVKQVQLWVNCGSCQNDSSFLLETQKEDKSQSWTLLYKQNAAFRVNVTLFRDLFIKMGYYCYHGGYRFKLVYPPANGSTVNRFIDWYQLSNPLDPQAIQGFGLISSNIEGASYIISHYDFKYINFSLSANDFKGLARNFIIRDDCLLDSRPDEMSGTYYAVWCYVPGKFGIPHDMVSQVELFVFGEESCIVDSMSVMAFTK